MQKVVKMIFIYDCNYFECQTVQNNRPQAVCAIKETSVTLSDPIYSWPKLCLCPIAPSTTPVSYYTCILCDIINICPIQLIFFLLKLSEAELPSFTVATEKGDPYITLL